MLIEIVRMGFEIRKLMNLFVCTIILIYQNLCQMNTFSYNSYLCFGSHFAYRKLIKCLSYSHCSHTSKTPLFVPVEKKQ